MKIGILGSGNVAQTLGSGLLKLGHEVTLGTRDTSKLSEWLKDNTISKARAESFKDAAEFGEVIFLATFGLATATAIDMAGVDNFKDKIVVDVTNPLDFSDGAPPKLASSPGNSLGEQIQKQLPKAKVVKAFNSIGAHIMIDAKREEGTPNLLIAGNDNRAKKWVADLASQWGWSDTIDIGGIDNAYWLEAFAMLWILYGFKTNNWQHAFKLLKK
jgi:predicted dinucleotide-binding enzyme